MKELKHKPKILKCKCGRYTLEEICPKCKEKTFNPNPPKFSIEDKYGKQRRKVLYERH